MKLLSKTDPGFAEAWETFFRTERTSPFFSPRWIQYQIAYAGDQHVEDLSFVGVDKSGRPLVICPLFLEEREGARLLSYRGEYLHALRAPLVTTSLSAKKRESVRNEAFEEIDRVAERTGAAKVTFLIDPLCEDSRMEGYNYLLRYGFLDASMTTVLIGLEQGAEPLRSSLRSSYKSLINQANREFSIEVFDSESIDASIFDAYVQLHTKAAGRVTRPERTFEIQFEMIRGDEGSLVGVRQGEDWVGFVQFLHSPTAAYYASGAQDPECDANTLGPGMQWAAMTYYGDRRLPRMELDNQYFGPQFFEIPSGKDIGISFFKRGFAGELTPLFRGTKYYDRATMEREIVDNAHRLVGAYFEQAG